MDEHPTDGGRLTAIFAKLPRAGQVKTRLVPPLSRAQAAALAEAMLADEVGRCARSSAFRTAVAHAPTDGASPAETDAWFAARFPGVARIAQRGEGLAERLERFFADALGAGGARTAVVVGSDAPLLSADAVAAAHRALEAGADVVLGPDGSGGYWLVGLPRPLPQLFREVAMSTPGMFDRTVALCEARGLAVERVEEGLDVDRPADVAALRAACRGMARNDPRFPARTWAVLETLDEALAGVRARAPREARR